MRVRLFDKMWHNVSNCDFAVYLGASFGFDGEQEAFERLGRFDNAIEAAEILQVCCSSLRGLWLHWRLTIGTDVWHDGHRWHRGGVCIATQPKSGPCTPERPFLIAGVLPAPPSCVAPTRSVGSRTMRYTGCTVPQPKAGATPRWVGARPR